MAIDVVGTPGSAGTVGGASSQMHPLQRPRERAGATRDDPCGCGHPGETLGTADRLSGICINCGKSGAQICRVLVWKRFNRYTKIRDSGSNAASYDTQRQRKEQHAMGAVMISNWIMFLQLFLAVAQKCAVTVPNYLLVFFFPVIFIKRE